MGYPPRNRESVSASYPLGGGNGGGALATFLPTPQAMLSSGLGLHVSQELLKGEQMAHQSFDRHGFEVTFLLKDLQAVRLGIDLQGQPMTHELARNIIALEVELDHALPHRLCARY